MTDTITGQDPPYLASLEQVVADVVAPAAAEIDRSGGFPARQSMRLEQPAYSGC